MLKLSRDQIESLRHLTESAFKKRLYAEVCKYWKSRCDELGEPSVKRVISQARMAAAGLRMTTGYDVLRFVNLTFALGERFELQPEYDWITEQLQDVRFDPTSAMDAVCRRVSAMLSGVGGDGE
jgi:hypothetical protein